MKIIHTSEKNINICLILNLLNLIKMYLPHTFPQLFKDYFWLIATKFCFKSSIKL